MFSVVTPMVPCSFSFAITKNRFSYYTETILKTGASDNLSEGIIRSFESNRALVELFSVVPGGHLDLAIAVERVIQVG